MRMRVMTAVWPELFGSAEWNEAEQAGLGADLLDETYNAPGPDMKMDLRDSPVSTVKCAERNCVDFPLASSSLWTAM